MQNMMMSPPPRFAVETITVNGNTYTCASGGWISVPLADARAMMDQGWNTNHAQGDGTTAQRPTSPITGTTFLDTTLGAMIGWDGQNWRNTVTGAVV